MKTCKTCKYFITTEHIIDTNFKPVSNIVLGKCDAINKKGVGQNGTVSDNMTMNCDWWELK